MEGRAMNPKAVINGVFGTDFIPISVLAQAMYVGMNEHVVTAVLNDILTDGSTPLMMEDDFETLTSAPESAKNWAIQYLLRCKQNPRLLSSSRVRARVGWRGADIASNKYVLAFLVTEFAMGKIAWYDLTLNASHWFGMKNITPREAATLLCGFNPHDDKCDPLCDSTGETNPGDFKILMRSFEDEGHEGRTLVEWLGIAQSKGLKHHSWIDEYVAAIDTASASRKSVQSEPSTVDDDLPKNTQTVNDAVAGFGPCVAKAELVDGLDLVGGIWDERLKRPERDGKEYLPALVQRGTRGDKRGALWNPLIFARIAVEKGHLNKGQAMVRFSRAWPQWMPELEAEMGEI